MAYRWYCLDHPDAGSTHDLYTDAHADATRHYDEDHPRHERRIPVHVYSVH